MKDFILQKVEGKISPLPGQNPQSPAVSSVKPMKEQFAGPTNGFEKVFNEMTELGKR
jgi:hypothetical protein